MKEYMIRKRDDKWEVCTEDGSKVLVRMGPKKSQETARAIEISKEKAAGEVRA